jgi:hypothetical protein
MRKLFGFIKHLFFAAKVIVGAVVAPVVSLVATTLQAKPISLGQLTFAFWRLLVWLFFVLCATTSVGVPPLIALLFLADLAIVGVQIVGGVVLQLKESPA